MPVESTALLMKQGIPPLEKASLDLQKNSPVKTEYGLPLVLLGKIHEGHQMLKPSRTLHLWKVAGLEDLSVTSNEPL